MEEEGRGGGEGREKRRRKDEASVSPFSVLCPYACMSHIHIHVHMYERTIQVYTRGCPCTIWVYTHMHVIMHMVHAFAHEYAYAYMHFHMHTRKWNAYTHIRVPYGCTRICTPKVHACAPNMHFHMHCACICARPPFPLAHKSNSLICTSRKAGRQYSEH